MSKLTHQNFALSIFLGNIIILAVFFLVVPFVVHGQNLGGQTLEVVLSFGQAIEKVQLEGIAINGITPDRWMVDSADKLHLYLTTGTKVEETIELKISQGVLLFQNGSLNQEIAQIVPVEHEEPLGEVIASTATRLEQTFTSGQRFVAKIQPAASLALGGTLVPFLIFNPTILTNLPYLPTYLYHFFTWFFSLLGLRKKRRPWGMVYNAITKEPISLTIVRLVDHATLRIIETQVTDNFGRFGFLPSSGTFHLEVVKPNFFYPSKIVSGKIDNDLANIYHNEVISALVVHFNIPLDPQDPRGRVENPALAIWRFINRLVSMVSLGFLIIGILISYLIVMFSPIFINFNIVYLYLAFLTLQVVFQVREIRPWGEIFDANTLAPVPLAIVSLIEAKYDRIVQTRLSDWDGRFHFLPKPGSYRLSVQKENYHFPALKKIKTKQYPHPYFGEDLALKPDEAVVNVDVPLDAINIKP